MRKLITILVIISMFTVAAFADYSEGFFNYTISDDSVTITGYFGDASEVTVPYMIAGYPVNTIGKGAFTSGSVKLLYLPETIMSIEEGAISDGIETKFMGSSDESETENDIGTQSEQNTQIPPDHQNETPIESQEINEKNDTPDENKIENSEGEGSIANDINAEDTDSSEKSEKGSKSYIYYIAGGIALVIFVIFICKRKK